MNSLASEVLLFWFRSKPEPDTETTARIAEQRWTQFHKD